jgi:hypothetical protein
MQEKPEPLNRNESGRFGALKSDSTHHFFRNACTKSGSLRFSQFSGTIFGDINVRNISTSHIDKKNIVFEILFTLHPQHIVFLCVCYVSNIVNPILKSLVMI